MIDRRRAHRFAIRAGASGTLRVLDDVLIERASSHTLTVLSSVLVTPGEELRVRLYLPDGRFQDVAAQAIDRIPALVGGQVRHRLQLRILREEAGE